MGWDRKVAINMAWNKIRWLESYKVDLQVLGIDKEKVKKLYDSIKR